MQNSLSETVPAVLRAELARKGIAKGVFAQRLGHNEAWLYRRLTGRAPMTLSDVDAMCDELALDPAALVSVAANAKKSTAGRGTGRRSRTPNPPGQEGSES